MTKFVTKKLTDIFNVVLSNGDNKPDQLPKGDIPLVSSGTENQGIVGKYETWTTIFPKYSLTLDMFGNAYMHSYKYQTVSHGRVNILLYKENDYFKPEIGLYLATIINKQTQTGVYGFSNMLSSTKAKKLNIQVPVTSDDKLDTEYMASYVQKIEASYVQKIEAYLAVLGYKSLADCQLNQHDLDVLHVKPKMKKFKVENLLYKVELKWHGNHKFDKLADTSESKTKEFNLPLLNAKHGNNGIMFYGRKDEWDQAKNIIDVVSNGAVATGDVYFQASNISVMWDAYALNTKQAVSTKAKEYIATSLKKAIKLIFGWENKAVWSKVRNIKITLPVTSSGEPDYAFMEDYITAIEKLKVIKIKQYLDQKLSAYQQLTK